MVKFIFNLVLSGTSKSIFGDSYLAKAVIEILYHVLYLYPLYIASFIYNSFYYLDIANDALLIERNMYKNEGVTEPSADLVTRIYNEIINALILLFFIIQSYLLSFLPYVGWLIQFFS